MFQSRARNVLLLAMAFTAAACDGSRPTSPTVLPLTAPPPTAPPSTVQSPNPSPAQFEMTGVVTDDHGTPIPGARVAIWNDYVDLASVLTDSLGRYNLNFKVAGTIDYPELDPVGTQGAVAFARVEAEGYEPYARFVVGPGQHLVENVRLRRIERIKAGESSVLSISPDDSVCFLDVWPGRELICRTLRVVAFKDGVMGVEAIPTQPGFELPTLEVYDNRTGAPRGNPTAIAVATGVEYTVRIEVPSGFGTRQSFVVKTSM